MKALILNADDFGLTPGVNEGIVRAHREGILTSTTLMANAPAFDDAVRRARENPSLGVGVHLVLIGGSPVAPPEEVPSLVDDNGRLPQSLPSFVARVTSGAIRREHIEKELQAQIGKIRSAGIEPTHVDSHKHTHAHPRVMNSVASMASGCSITRIRKPFEELRDSWNSTEGERGSAMAQLAASAAARIASRSFIAICRRYGLRSPDRFLGLARTGSISASVLRGLIDTVADGTTEIMLHPGICDSDLRETGSRLQMQRQVELDALVAAQVKEIVSERGIRLITYREVN
ncbi:MAG: carbohydrate deacetylase [Candidatus Acidiferrales bacterium]